MKITDEMRLDWLAKNFAEVSVNNDGVWKCSFTWYGMEIKKTETWYCEAESPRQAIDSAIRAERRKRT